MANRIEEIIVEVFGGSDMPFGHEHDCQVKLDECWDDFEDCKCKEFVEFKTKLATALQEYFEWCVGGQIDGPGPIGPLFNMGYNARGAEIRQRLAGNTDKDPTYIHYTKDKTETTNEGVE